MRSISFDQIRDAISSMYRSACTDLQQDVVNALQESLKQEKDLRARDTLSRLLENSELARQHSIPICQDTGVVIVFVEWGQEVHLVGGSLREAIDQGVREGYQAGSLRASVVDDPLLRVNTGDNTPAVVYTELVEGEAVRLRLMAKGGGGDNMSKLKMLTPGDGREGIIDFVVETAFLAGPNACPPLVVGVGIGGTFDYSAVLAKKSLLRELAQPSTLPHVAELEREILIRINDLGIGPQGYGGKTTALAVQIEVAPCHIASVPVTVNIECHAHRCREVIL